MFKSAWFKQIGRLTFLLSTASVAVLSGGALLLEQSHPDSLRVAAAVKGLLIVLGVFWIRSLERRLVDAGLPRWFFWPYFLAVAVACAGLHARGILDEQTTLAFFVVLQIPTVLFPSKPAPGGTLLESPIKAGAPVEAYPEYNKPVGRFQFLLRVVVVAALFAALLELARETGQEAVSWGMRLGVILAAFVWIYSVEGRVMDAGLPRWFSIPYCLIVPGMSILPHLVRIISLRTALVLFVVLQIPTLFFQSRTASRLPAPLDTREKEASQFPAKQGNKPAGRTTRFDGLEFAVYVLLIAGLWYVMHLLRGDVVAGNMSGSLECGLDAGALVLCVLWIVTVRGRLRDAGLTPWTMDFCLVVFSVSLLPLAFGVIGFPLALVLFVALQVPAIVVRRGSISSRFLPIEADF